jgi:Rieske Fe-S protein
MPIRDRDNPLVEHASTCTRRCFLGATAGATLSVVFGGCRGGDAVDPGATSTQPSGLPAGVTRVGSVFTVDLAANAALRTSGLLLLLGAATPVLVARVSLDSFVAYDARCPHAGSVLQWSLAEEQLVCTSHGSRFRASTGGVLLGPATTALRALPLRRIGALLEINAD